MTCPHCLQDLTPLGLSVADHHDGDAFLCERRVEPPAELHFCSRCRDNAEFTLDPNYGWLSVCCDARAIPVDVEAP